MGISWLRSVRFELCIFTARESDVVSPGSGVNIDSRVIVNEQSLQRLSRDIEISIYCLIIFFMLDLLWFTTLDPERYLSSVLEEI